MSRTPNAPPTSFLGVQYRALMAAQPAVRIYRKLRGRQPLPMPSLRNMARIAVGRPARRRVPPDVHLAVAAVYRNEAPYLREWLDFHRLMGVERFFLYDNESTDQHRDVLAPYERDGLVVRHDWPGTDAPQLSAYGDCLARHGREAHWIAFIDLDEYLFDATCQPITATLDALAMYPGIALAWVGFGPSGRVSPPPYPMVWAYRHRSPDEHDDHNRIKSVIDPLQAVPGPPQDTHHFHYRAGFAVDITGQMAYGNRISGRPVRLDGLRVNHYWTKSLEEFRARRALPDASTGRARPELTEGMLARFDHTRDDAILRAIAAAVRRSPGVADWLAERPAGAAPVLPVDGPAGEVERQSVAS